MSRICLRTSQHRAASSGISRFTEARSSEAPGFSSERVSVVIFKHQPPFLTQMVEPKHQPQVASTLAWLIALVAAANSFFNLQKASALQTQLTLQFALTEWELRTAEAR